MISRLREPVNTLTHLAGALLGLVGLVVLVGEAEREGTPWHVASFAVFGVTAVLVYATSTLYHGLDVGERGVRMLRRLDHVMIYFLIAGTYTPVCLVALHGTWGWSMLGIVWSMALLGVLFKVFWLHAPEWVSIGFYLAMGWTVVVAAQPLFERLDATGLLWMFAGGVLYSVGAIVVAFEPQTRRRAFGHHELWHVFAMGGTLCHFLLMQQSLLHMGVA